MKNRTPWIVLLAVTVLTVASAGCEVTTGSGFDPRGDEVALRTAGAWLINGADANAARCEAAGLETIRLVFVDGGKTYAYDEFTFPCADGSYMSDTRVLARGVYTVKWEALNADGDVTNATSTPQTLDADRDSDLAVIDTPNFSGLPQSDATLTVSLGWDLDETDGFDGVTCDDLGEIASISYTLVDTTAEPEVVVAEESDVSCQDMLLFAAPDVTPGQTYRLDITGGPDAESPYWEANCPGLEPSASELESPCDVQDVRPRLAVALQWDKTTEAGFLAGECAGNPVVSFMTYSLVDVDADPEVVVATETGVACSNDLVFAAPDVQLGRTYRLDVDGGSTAESTDWSVSCTELSAGAGAPAEFNCAIGYVL